MSNPARSRRRRTLYAGVCGPDIYEKLTIGLIDRKLTQVDWSRHPAEAKQMDRLGRTMVGLPTVRGSGGELFSDTDDSDELDSLEWGRRSRRERFLENALRLAGPLL